MCILAANADSTVRQLKGESEMVNHSGSCQNNDLLHRMIDSGVFETLDMRQSLAVLREMSSLEDGSKSEIFEGIPESLHYCVECEDFKEAVRYSPLRGYTLCKSCSSKHGTW
jgi:hypothetical protein